MSDCEDSFKFIIISSSISIIIIIIIIHLLHQLAASQQK